MKSITEGTPLTIINCEPPGFWSLNPGIMSPAASQWEPRDSIGGSGSGDRICYPPDNVTLLGRRVLCTTPVLEYRDP